MLRLRVPLFEVLGKPDLSNLNGILASGLQPVASKWWNASVWP